MAHLVVQFFLMTAQTSIMMLVLYIMFLHPLSGNLALIIALLYCVAFVGIAVGKHNKSLIDSNYIFYFLLNKFKLFFNF